MTPSPTPVSSPIIGPGSTPRITITPGAPNPAQLEAYNAARTPQVTVTLAATTTPVTGVSGTDAASSRAASTFQPKVVSGACMSITLRPAAAAALKTSRASISSAASQGQPVATVVLAYNAGHAGQLVWVQPLRGGTLTAIDGSGRTYDGSQGLYLTLGTDGTATFSYQAPDASGTYQVLTRFSNVATALPFLVPDLAP